MDDINTVGVEVAPYWNVNMIGLVNDTDSAM